MHNGTVHQIRLIILNMVEESKVLSLWSLYKIIQRLALLSYVRFCPYRRLWYFPNPKSPNFETPELLGLSTRPKSASLHPVMARDLIHVTDLFKEVFSWFTWACPFPSSSPIIFSPKDLNSRIICVNTRLFRKSTHHCVWGFLNPSLLKDTNFSLIVTQFSSTSHHHSSASACAGSP